MKKSYIIGGAVIVLALALAMYSFKSTLTSYVTVSEAKASKQSVQVAGIVVEGTDRYDLKSNNLLFTLREDGGDEQVEAGDERRLPRQVTLPPQLVQEVAGQERFVGGGRIEADAPDLPARGARADHLRAETGQP